jgi:hypothetical protein
LKPLKAYRADFLTTCVSKQKLRQAEAIQLVRINRELDLVRTLWPTCPARMASDGESILIQPANLLRNGYADATSTGDSSGSIQLHARSAHLVLTIPTDLEAAVVNQDEGDEKKTAERPNDRRNVSCHSMDDLAEAIAERVWARIEERLRR